MNARAGVEGEVDSDRERWKKEMVSGKVGGDTGYGLQQRSALAAAVVGTAQRSNAGTETAQKAGKDREKHVLEVSNFNSVNVGIEHEIYV